MSDGDFITRAKGDRFTEEELVAAIREYMDEHDGHLPTWSELRAWAHNPTVRERPGRRPPSFDPFHRFGGYRAVLVRNGLVSADDARIDGRGRVLPVSWRFSDDELRSAVLAVADHIGHPPPETAYRRFREQSEPGMPSVSTLTNRFGGTWGAVIEAVFGPGVLARAASRPTSGKTAPYSRDDMVEALKEAWRGVGEPFSKNAYKRWRLRKLARDP